MKLANFTREHADTLAGGPAVASSAAVSTHASGTASMHVASAVSIADAGNYYTSTTVEGALQELGGVTGDLVVYDEGVVQGTATSLDFIGSGVSAAMSGGTAQITVTSGSAYSNIPIFDEGSLMGTATTGLNFVGSGVSGTVTSGTGILTISGGFEAPTAYVRQYIASNQSVNTNSHALTLPGSPASNVILLAWGVESASITISSISQTGASWSKLYSYVNGNSIEVWYTPSGATSTGITVTMSGTGYSHCAAMEVVGISGTLAGTANTGTPFFAPLAATSANFQIITARSAGGSGTWDCIAQPFPTAIPIVEGTNGAVWFADGPTAGYFLFTQPSGTSRIVSIGSID